MEAAILLIIILIVITSKVTRREEPNPMQEAERFNKEERYGD